MAGHPRDRCRQLDEQAIALGIPGLLLMEHASIGAALLAQQKLGDLRDRNIWLLCGPGNNGGDGYAMARHFHNAGARVRVWDLARPADPVERLSDSDTNRQILVAMGIPPVAAHEALPELAPPTPDLIVDAVFGTGLNRAPTGRFAGAVAIINANRAPVLSVDIPSGLDADQGIPLGCAVEATWTATFGLPKQGFFEEGSSRFTGELHCVPIGIPRQLLPAGMPAFPPAPRQVVREGDS